MSALALQQPPLACRPLHSTSAAPHAHASSAAVAARHRGRGRGRAAHAFPQAAAERSLSPGAALDQAEPLSPTFRLGREVGRGSFAQAFEAIDTRTGGGVCAKKLPRYLHNKQPCQQAAAVAAEASTLRALSAACPSIVRFLDVRQDSSFFYLITELCISDLAQHLHARDGARLSEREAAHITRQLLTALDACARLGVAYRDVKPANLLIRSITADGLPEVVLADFGQARLTTGPQPSNRCSAGTPLYSAPECVYGVGGQESDVWSAGILLYHLLSGAFPFCDPRHQITQGEYWKRVETQPIHYAGPHFHGVSPGAVALLRRMLDRDTSRRITAAEALQDPWLLDATSSRGRPSAAAAAPAPAQRVVGSVVPGPHHKAAQPQKLQPQPCAA